MSISSLGVRGALATLTALALVPLGLGGPANAAPPAAPGALAPVGDVSTNTPLFSWSRPGGAVKFRIQIDVNDDDCDSPEIDVTTTNTRYVPTRALAAGTRCWQVQALNAKSEASSFSSAFIDVSMVDAPVPVAPLTGSDPLVQPENPPLLRWQPVKGATEYTVQVDVEPDENPFKTYKTKTVLLAIPDPLEAQTYHWRVKAARGPGVESNFSAWQQFTLTPLPDVTIVAPKNLAPVEDVELDWNPRPGAAWYQVEVATDDDFVSIIDEQTKVLGTNYSPAKTYDNGAYFWRVRGVDTNGNVSPWPDTFGSFTREWPDTPATVFPADAGTSSLDLAPQEFNEAPYFQWTPVQHATQYEIQIGTDENFSPGTYDTCQIAGTTFTPQHFYVHNDTGLAGIRAHEDCWIWPDTDMYWRVRPLDLPFTRAGTLVPGVQGIFSEIERFVWQPQEGATFSPSGGQVVDVPTFEWDFPTEAERYRIEVKDKFGATVVAPTWTWANSYTPVNTLKLDPAKGPFTWRVTAYDATGPFAPGNSLGHHASQTIVNSFNVSGDEPPTSGEVPLTPLTGIESDSPTLRAPALSWEPMPGAAYYRLFAGNADANDIPGDSWFGGGFEDAYSGKKLYYPEVTDTGKRFLEAGRYDWWVVAYDAANAAIGMSPEETFRIVNVAPATGQSVALEGRTLAQGNGCELAKPAICNNAPSTPVLSWDPVEGASLYMIYLADDAGFTSVVEPLTNVAATTTTRWSPTMSNDKSALADNVADKAYHWFVRPCKRINVCGPNPISTPEVAINQFRKASKKVELETPDGAVVTTADVTLDWKDYFTTNQAASSTWSVTGEKSPQAAQWYRVQVDNDQEFTSPLETVLVDQSRFTSATRLYPEGNLWWRVQAVDADNNDNPWSDPRHVTKASPNVVPESPVTGSNVSGATHFEWKPQAGASKYLLEVFKSTEMTAGNLLFSATVKQSAYTWDRPIPASAASYSWRVTRIDSSMPTNSGPPSFGGVFQSNGSAPSLLAPPAGTYQPSNGPLFSWSDVPGAGSYLLEVRVAGASFNWANITTPATSWAADRLVSDGSYSWRVTAKDAGGAAIGVSAWRSFNVDASRPRVVSYTPLSSARYSQNVVVKFSEAVGGVGSGTFKLRRQGTTAFLSATRRISADRKTAVLDPSSNLRRGATYIVYLTSGIKDQRGNTLTAKSWTFRVS